MTVDAREQLRKLVYDASEVETDVFLPLSHQALAEAWDAPGMDAYDDYDADRSATS